ncbi:MAG: DoxX family protein [Pseudomonadota bacterium]
MDTLRQLAELYAPLLGRLLMAFIFLQSACEKTVLFTRNVEVMTRKGIPLAGLLLVPAVLVMLSGGLSLLLGWHARWGALALLLFVGTALPFYHPYWKFTAMQRTNEFLHFMKNLAILGMLLFIIGMGPGPLSLSAGW